MWQSGPCARVLVQGYRGTWDIRGVRGLTLLGVMRGTNSALSVRGCLIAERIGAYHFYVGDPLGPQKNGSLPCEGLPSVSDGLCLAHWGLSPACWEASPTWSPGGDPLGAYHPVYTSRSGACCSAGAWTTPGLLGWLVGGLQGWGMKTQGQEPSMLHPPHVRT